MGYDEQQYSLPRWRDLSVSRSTMYDDMYSYLPTQGWMFLPITDCENTRIDPLCARSGRGLLQSNPSSCIEFCGICQITLVEVPRRLAQTSTRTSGGWPSTSGLGRRLATAGTGYTRTTRPRPW